MPANQPDSSRQTSTHPAILIQQQKGRQTQTRRRFWQYAAAWHGSVPAIGKKGQATVAATALDRAPVRCQFAQ